MSKALKPFTIAIHRNGRVTEVTKTLPEFLEYFKYTLECGKSWEREKGNKKINMNPKSAKALITQVTNAGNNAAGNGYCSTLYSLVETVVVDTTQQVAF